eukprot:TRINITY_DN16516_c0_g1_i1.p1 TRINITY_DN16516_c0_g1~~TRINITY_DN16516_c0_g1_i1.p1  ORF type:complete len:857 (-),score=159.97 TRINITY_DN16516_c0_g1_i1:2303-4675(-)
MEKALNFRKSSCPIAPFPSSLFLLLYNGHCNITQISHYRSLTHSRHNPCGNFPYSILEKCPVSKNCDSGIARNSFPFFSSMAEKILVQARNPSQLGVELVNAIDERRFEDGWRLYEQYMHMDGFPRKSILNKVITAFAESQVHYWLDKAYGLVEMVFSENKYELLEKESLIYLSYVLARCGFPVPASTILRKVVEMEDFVPVSVWSGIIAHMSQTATGAYLAAELIFEIGYIFQNNRVDPRKKCNRPLLSMKPDTTAFNIALTGCLLSGTTKKAEQLLEFMPRVGVKTDVGLLIVMAHIYERNGHREEIKKLKRFIDEACSLNSSQIQQFHNCLLSCHLKFGDLDSASEMVLEMLQKSKEARRSLSAVTLVMEAAGTTKSSDFEPNSMQPSDQENSSFSVKFKLTDSKGPSFVEFSADRTFSRLDVETKELLDLLSAKLHKHVELVTSERGILQPTEKMYAKLVRTFLEAGKISDLAAFLIKADKENVPVSTENSAFVHVINACISLRWLDQSYDLLDEMRLAGVRTGSSVYSSLLKAYCEENRPREITSLLRDARKDGIQLDSSCYEALIQSRVLQNDNSGALRLFKEMKEAKIPKTGQHQFEMLVRECADSGEAGLMAKLLEEIKEEQRVDCGVNDWNNVIHFFCKRRLMQDAQKALKKMMGLGHQPNAQTFHSLVTGYAALGGKYLEITELWGEMKVLALSSSMKFDQELLDSLLYSFVRGGFFLRANEVVEMMERGDLFIDKYKYRTLFLKYHRTLYKGKAPKFQTEAQCKRREAALTFKKWVGLN